MPYKNGYYYPGNTFTDPNLGSPTRVNIVSGSTSGGTSTSVVFPSPQPVSVTQVITASFAGTAQPVSVNNPVTNVTASIPNGISINGTVPVTGNITVLNPVSSVTASFAGITQPVTLNQISTVNYNLSSSFSGGIYQVLLGPLDLSSFTNVCIFVVNNSSIALTSGALEWSPNNNVYEFWDTASFTNLQPGVAKSMQIWGNSRKWFRFRGVSFTGSLDVYVQANNG